MKIITCICTLFVFAIFHSKVYGQNNNYKPKVEKCGTMQMLEQLQKKDPSLKQRMMQIEQDIQKRIKQKKAEHLNLAASVRVIPVVVHVVYNTAAQNISDAQILSQINVLNEDYRRIQGTHGYNTDTLGADTHIEFRLATKDPSGNATNGITRDSTSITFFNLEDSRLKNSIDGGVKPWNTNQYLNIWVCKLKDSLKGYSEFPGGPTAIDGVVIGYEYFGDNVGIVTTARFQFGRTTTHEVGHWLDLYHTWGDEDDCSGTDFVDDTPPCSGGYDSPESTCYAPIQCKHTRQIQNYMDYSDDGCMNMFTKGQSDRMNAILDGVRNSVTRSPGLDNRDFTLFSTHTGTYEYNVTDSISTNADNPYSNFLISDTNNVTLRAGSNITLKPGFNVTDGAIFKAYIDNSILTTFKSTTPLIENSIIPENKKLDIANDPSIEILQVYPNPFTNKLTISYNSINNDKISVEVFSLTGTRIALLQQPNKITKGKYSIEWNATNIPSGIYIIVLTNSTGKKIQKVVKL